MPTAELYSEQDLERFMKAEAHLLEETPKKDYWDLEENKHLPSSETYRLRYNTYNNAVEAAGLEPRAATSSNQGKDIYHAALECAQTD